jgi:hypothetical protein
MEKKLKRYVDFMNEAEVAEPTTKPITKPTTTPTRRKSPIRRDKPSVTPKPKAGLEDVTNRVIQLAQENKEFKAFLNKKYKK